MPPGNLDSGVTAEELEASFAPKKAATPKVAAKPAAPKTPKTDPKTKADA
jgi:hypothetical protein